MPARSAAQVVTIHDLNFLTPSRTHARARSAATIRRWRARTRTAPTASSCLRAFTAGEVERQLGVPARADRDLPAGRADVAAARTARRRDGYILFFGTLEPRKNVGGLLDAYERLRRRGGCRRYPSCVLAGKATAGSAAVWLDAPRPRRRSRASCATSATSIRRTRARAVRRRAAPGAAVVRGGLRHPGARSDDARRAGRRGEPRRPAGSARRRRSARRSGRRRRHGGRDRSGC